MTDSPLAWLDRLSAEFVAAVREDPSYVIDLATAGSKLRERREGRSFGVPALDGV